MEAYLHHGMKNDFLNWYELRRKVCIVRYKVTIAFFILFCGRNKLEFCSHNCKCISQFRLFCSQIWVCDLTSDNLDLFQSCHFVSQNCKIEIAIHFIFQFCSEQSELWDQKLQLPFLFSFLWQKKNNCEISCVFVFYIFIQFKVHLHFIYSIETDQSCFVHAN